jgi:hypothetical protein
MVKFGHSMSLNARPVEKLVIYQDLTYNKLESEISNQPSGRIISKCIHELMDANCKRLNYHAKSNLAPFLQDLDKDRGSKQFNHFKLTRILAINMYNLK